MKTIKRLVTILALSFGFSIFAEFVGWRLSDGVQVFLGFVDVVCIVWLLIHVYSKK
jgi:hypothetical protein